MDDCCAYQGTWDEEHRGTEVHEVAEGEAASVVASRMADQDTCSSAEEAEARTDLVVASQNGTCTANGLTWVALV